MRITKRNGNRLLVAAVTILAVSAWLRANPIPQAVCYGFTGDTCRNTQLNGFRETNNPCPGSAVNCEFTNDIPPGNFVCQLCTTFPNLECPGCVWTLRMDVTKFKGQCNGDDQDCGCNYDPNFPQLNVVYICGAI